VKPKRCPYCKRILYPWQKLHEIPAVINLHIPKVTLHAQCWRDIRAMAKQDEVGA
jgi:hypothetical protein